MGSSFFAVLFFTLTIVTNILFLVVSVLLWGLTSSESYLTAASLGIWTVLLGVIAVECSEAPPDMKRRLFFFEVPALYYPLVLLALFSMFAGFRLAYGLGVAVGYAYGYGKLDRWKVKVETVSTSIRCEVVPFWKMFHNIYVAIQLKPRAPALPFLDGNCHAGEKMGKSRRGRVLEQFCSKNWIYYFRLG